MAIYWIDELNEEWPKLKDSLIRHLKNQDELIMTNYNKHKPGTLEDVQWRKENGQYPYWLDELSKEWPEKKVLLYCEGKPNHKYSDEADNYRVFMILCNNLHPMTRAEVLEKLLASTFENPIQINNEYFWVEEEE